MIHLDEHRFNEEDEEIRDLLKQLPQVEAPPDLTRRVLEQLDRRRRRQRLFWRLAPAIAIPAAAAAVLAIVLIPRTIEVPRLKSPAVRPVLSAAAANDRVRASRLRRAGLARRTGWARGPATGARAYAARAVPGIRPASLNSDAAFRPAARGASRRGQPFRRYMLDRITLEDLSRGFHYTDAVSDDDEFKDIVTISF